MAFLPVIGSLFASGAPAAATAAATSALTGGNTSENIGAAVGAQGGPIAGGATTAAGGGDVARTVGGTIGGQLGPTGQVVGQLSGSELGQQILGPEGGQNQTITIDTGLADFSGVLEDALALSERLFNEARTESRELLSPFIQAGTEAIPGVQQAIGGFGEQARGLFGDIQAGQFDPRNISFTADLDSPEFQSIIEGGTRAIDAASATGGLLGSGARARALTEFGQQAANQFTQDVLNRRLGLSSQLLGQQLSGLDVLRSDIANQQSLLGTGLGAAGQLSSGLLGAAGQQSNLGAGIFGDIASLGLQQQSLALAEQQRQQDLIRQQEAQEDARRNQLLGLVGSALGAGVGFLGGGGPIGGAVGSQVGGQLGSSLA